MEQEHVTGEPRTSVVITRQMVCRGLLTLIGLILVAAPVGIDLRAGEPISLGRAGWIAVLIGAIYVIVAWKLPRLPRLLQWSGWLLVGLPGLLLLLEIGGRMLAIDFDRLVRGHESTPIYYRQPHVPVGEVFFRRPGPASWTGKVLTAQLARMRVAELDAYPDETTKTISYDHQGFRNPIDLADWEIAIAGDAFVELGYLAESELFTSRLAGSLGVRVKNLGVAYSGTWSHLCYLRQFGVAESTRDLVIVFYEGNDWKESLREYQALQNYREADAAEVESRHRPQTSIIRALVVGLSCEPVTVVNACFCHEGDRIDVTVQAAPPDRAALGDETVVAVQEALREFAELARGSGTRPWLVYMPCKRHVLHGYLEFKPHCPPEIVNWQPGDLSVWLKGLCDQNAIRFVDLTETLRAGTREGELLFNHVYDSHLNKKGAARVAARLGEVFRGRDDSDSER